MAQYVVDIVGITAGFKAGKSYAFSICFNIAESPQNERLVLLCHYYRTVDGSKSPAGLSRGYYDAGTMCQNARAMQPQTFIQARNTQDSCVNSNIPFQLP